MQRDLKHLINMRKNYTSDLSVDFLRLGYMIIARFSATLHQFMVSFPPQKVGFRSRKVDQTRFSCVRAALAKGSLADEEGLDI